MIKKNLHSYSTSILMKKKLLCCVSVCMGKHAKRRGLKNWMRKSKVGLNATEAQIFHLC